MKAFITAGALACTGFAVLLFADVKTDYNHSTDFARYHTYSWIKVDASDSLWADRIQKDIDGQLQAKGWTMSQSGGDVSLSAWGKVKNEQSMQTFYDGLGGGWGWRHGWGGGWGGEGMATTTVENTPVGTLTVDMFDGQSKKLIWRSISTKTLSSKPDKNDKKLESSVEDMFKKFPPHGE